MKTSYDAVVIGAGHNGLACAIHLAKRGWRVGVFEAKDEAGGAVKTRALTLPGFRHDVAAMNLSMFAGSPFLRENGEALARHGLAFVPAEDCFASVFPDETWLGVSKTLDKTLSRLGPKDAEAWQRMLAKFGEDAPHIFGLLGSCHAVLRGFQGGVEGLAAEGHGVDSRHAALSSHLTAKLG